MTDERMTQGDVRLREELADVIHDHAPMSGYPGNVACRCDGLVRERDQHDRHVADALERIVAARVGEVVERVEAVCDEWDRMTEADPYDPGNPGGYADEIRAALKATP